MGSGPTFRVTAYPTWGRLLVGAALVVSRLSLPVMLFAVLGSRFAVEAFTVVRWFAVFFGLPAMAAVVITRGLRASVCVAEDELSIVRPGVRIDVPAAAIAAVTAWRVPIPSAGIDVRLASGRRLGRAMATADPVPLLAALARYGVATRHAADRPSVVYAHARAAWGAWRWTHLVARFPLFALLPTAPLFNVHQHIAYGGLFGQYYMLGLRPYLETFALYWATVTVYLVFWASLWRGPAELACWTTAAVAPSRAATVRRRAEQIVRILYYGGVPVLLGLRFAPW